MDQNRLWSRAPILVALVVALGVVAWARPAVRLHADTAPGAAYTLDWWTVDGGGQTAPPGSGYTLEGTIGQSDAAQWEGGRYTLAGGFWVGAGGARYEIHLPLVMR